MNNFRAKFRVLILLTGAVGMFSMGVRSAHAIASDPCAFSSGSYVVADGDSCTVDLTQSNVDFFDNNILVRLLVTNPLSGNTTIQLSLESAPSGLTLLGFDRFGLNAGPIIGFPTGWGNCGGQGNISDFGNFSVCASDSGGTDQTPTFELAGDISSFPGNDPEGTHFATHLRFGTNPPSTCSAFVGDSNVATNPIGSDECNGGGTTTTSSVPEPSALLLVGLGLVTLARVTRKYTQEI